MSFNKNFTIEPALNLMLGTACNKHCSYCMQPKHGSNGKVDINEFLAKFFIYTKAHHPNGYKYVEYWGGEPLLYFDAIKSIHLFLKEHKLFANNSRARIITNGSLISDEFVQFCNDNDILVNLSWHDGMLSDDQLIKFLQINRIYVTSVITHTHLSLDSDYAAWTRLCSLGRVIKWQVYPVHCTDNCAESEYLTKKDVDTYFRHLSTLLSSNEAFYKYILKHLYSTYVEHKAILVEPKCYGNRSLSVDLHGNRYHCHHIMQKENIAYNIFNSSCESTSAIRFDKFFNTDRCQQCNHLSSCLGGCYLSNRHDVECYWVHSAYNFCVEHKDVIQS